MMGCVFDRKRFFSVDLVEGVVIYDSIWMIVLILWG